MQKMNSLGCRGFAKDFFQIAAHSISKSSAIDLVGSTSYRVSSRIASSLA
jgi:hypothetical protein